MGPGKRGQGSPPPTPPEEQGLEYKGRMPRRPEKEGGCRGVVREGRKGTGKAPLF